MDTEIINKIVTGSGIDLLGITCSIFNNRIPNSNQYKLILKKRLRELNPPAGDWNQAVRTLDLMSKPENYDYREGLPKILGYWCDYVEGDNPYFLLINHNFNFAHIRYLGSVSFKKLSEPKIKKKKEPKDKEFEQIKAIFK